MGVSEAKSSDPSHDAAVFLAAIVASSDDAILSKSLDGIVTSWNEGARRIYGYSAEEIVGRPIEVLVPEELQDEEKEILARIRRGERIDHFKTQRIRRDGRRIDVSLTISPVRDASGEIIGASKIARDITDWIRIEEELRRAKDQAEEACRARDRFLAALSHELRTPLTPALAILSFIENLETIRHDLREEISNARRNVELEARLIDDLLDVNRITQGKLELHNEGVDLHQLVRSALQVFQSEADAKGLEISLAFHAARHHVWADPSRLQQVFWNLIKNAIQFTPEGGKIRLSSTNVGNDVVVSVSDSGVGIEASDMERIFDAFEQSSRPDIARRGGLGLGLTIARMITENHGGRLAANSQGINSGATFTVQLQTLSMNAPGSPATANPAVPKPKSPTKESSPMSEKIKVLVVDDNPDTLRSLSRLLRLSGFDVHEASNCRDAIAALDTAKFDVMLCDIGLPDGSGLDVMRHARSLKDKPLKGIAFSGYGSADDVDASREAGFEHHLTKPVRFDVLTQILVQTAG